MKLENKVAIVTGGASGMGRAIALRYGQEGARVCVADIDHHAAQLTAERIGHGAFACRLDVTEQISIDTMVEMVLDIAGGIDILVNSAGIFDAGSIETVTREQWARLFAVNVEGSLFTLQAVAKQMIAQGRGGKIINLSSQGGRRGDARVLAYGASKAAVISVTQSAALHLIKHRINVNAIAPGVVDTPMWDIVDREFGKLTGREPGKSKELAGSTVPFGRMGKPEDFGGIAVFLASDDSEYVVAQTYGVDGGNWMA
jgi:D-sorbitol dehydrogenase (acceptor)